ncbi:hypothetical protein [Paraglaciecola marina]|uniref:hypothetical protein n=1 Tax=Paraglaciecola marina TaxID=2500157 RepID=UPI00105C744B|nr:hypothetical protein [Paraglaciecola marina]
MDNIERMTQAWAQQNEKLEQSIAVSSEALKQVALLKAEKTMGNFLMVNTFTVIVGILMSSFMLHFIVSNMSNINMLLAGAAILIWSCLITMGGIRHLFMQLTLDYSKPVIDVQRQLNKIGLSVLYYLRASLLILPFYFAYIVVGFELFFGVDIVQHGDTNWLISQLVCSVLFAVLAIYLFKQLSPNNVDKPLTKVLLRGCGNQAWRAAQELNELQRYAL